MNQRTSSPIGDPEPVHELPDVPPLTDPVEEETLAFRQDGKYSKVLDKFRARQDAYRQEMLLKPDNMSYEAFGMKAELNTKLIQEIDNFISDIELTYGLQKQQG